MNLKWHMDFTRLRSGMLSVLLDHLLVLIIHMVKIVAFVSHDES